jgi:Secretion system C-terminal sorting domain/Leucine Rich repeats (2 copies)
MKNLLQTLAIALAIALNSTNAKAQYVTIPDPYFAELLNELYPTCMDGNMIDTTCIEILSETELTLNYFTGYYKNIENLTGLIYFKNLQNLFIQGLAVTSLPPLPSSLKSFICSETSIISFPQLPSTLEYLNLQANKMTSLPVLPSTITYLNCSNNQLTSLPTLPSSLQFLYCSENQIMSLPDLPASLAYLYCDNNQIISLPEIIPTELSFLNCSYNLLTNLPEMPTVELFDLDCSYNSLTSLPQLPDGLFFLNCSYNSLTNIPEKLPENLTTIKFNGNTGINCFPKFNNFNISVYWSETGIACIPDGVKFPSGIYPSINGFPNCLNNNPNECDFIQSCPAATNLKTTLETNGYTLSWKAPIGSTKCELGGRILDKKKLFKKIIAGIEPSSIFISEKVLRANTTYLWYVICNCEASNLIKPISDYSDYSILTTGTDLDFGFPKSNDQNIFAEESNIATTSTNVKLFPNPAKGSFNINTDLENYNIELTDITGKLIYNQNNINQTFFNMDIKNIEAGTYFVKISNASSSEVVKLMVY